MASRFLNLNLTGEKPEPKYTGKDVAAEKPEVSTEKIDQLHSEPTALSDLAKAVESSEQGNSNKAFNIKFIPREKIAFNDNNDFDMEDVESLSVKLLENGLLHNLVALYNEDTDKYVLESGERRLRAFDLAHERFKDVEDIGNKEYQLYEEHIKDLFIHGFPVNVKKAKYQDEQELSRVDEIDSNLRKYTANIDVRTYTPQQRAEYTQKIRTLMEEKNQLLYGDKAPKVTQAQLAEATGITERQIRKYDQVQELIPALRAEFEHGNLSINKVPTIAKMSEEEQLVFLDFLQREKNADPAQVKLYMERAERAEREKSELKQEKEQIESDLEELQANRDAEIQKILEESKQKENKIREEIAKAEKQSNAERIAKLQDELTSEKDSAERMIKESNNRLQTAQEALKVATQRIQELENQEPDTEQMEELYRVRAELDMNLSYLKTLCKKTLSTLDNYKRVAEPEEIDTIMAMLGSMKELKQLFTLLK